MKVTVTVTMPYEEAFGRCERCVLAMQANDRISSELQDDGSWWPVKPYPGDHVLCPTAGELYDHLQEHVRLGHPVPAKCIEKAEREMRLSREKLKMIRTELKTDPAGLEYAGKPVEDQWHLLNNILVPFTDALGNRVGYTSRANLLFRHGIRLADVIMATYH